MKSFEERVGSLKVGERHTGLLKVLLDLKEFVFSGGGDVEVFLKEAERLYTFVPELESFSRREYNGIVGWVLRLVDPRGLVERREALLPKSRRAYLQISPVKLRGYELVWYNENYVWMLNRRFGDIDGYFDGYNTTFVYEGGGIKKVDYDERCKKRRVATEVTHDGLLFGRRLYPGAIRLLLEGEKAAYLLQAALYSVGRLDIETYAAGGKGAMRKLVYGLKKLDKSWFLAPDSDAYSVFSGWGRVLPDPVAFGVSDYGDFSTIEQFKFVAEKIANFIYTYESKEGVSADRKAGI